MSDRRVIEPDLDFIRAVRRAGGDTVKKCYQCATCSVTCNLSPAERPFPRKEMILAGWGQTDKLIKDPDLWLCYQCNDCSTRCPREAKPGDVLAAIRSWVYSKYSFPSFMGKALASKAALPLLLLVPVVFLVACIYFFAPRAVDGSFVFMTSDVIDFNLFLPHSSVDALFVIGNILIFLFAAIGFFRFWKALNAGNQYYKMSFVSALIQTVKEIISHTRFRECEANKPRWVGHMLLLGGFVGAMITTGCVFVFVFIPHYLDAWGLASMHSFFTVPLGFFHPVKIIGALSGVALVIGGAILIMRRRTDPEEVGAHGYGDNLFITIIFLTGLTGMLSWLLRLTGSGLAAYPMYFIHMVCVYFLLWYMPYSKFAHMIYRTLALVYAKRVGRISRSELIKQAA
jgi:quinone-modifying oxidoreductase subunit QmoC